MVDLLLFDLGGVLVEYSGIEDLAALLPAPMPEADIRERLKHCPHSAAFELGHIGAEDFARGFVRDWGIDLAPDAFLQNFRCWSRGLLPGADVLLASLRPRFRLAALSNANEAHWSRNTDVTGVTELFEMAISSHQVGLRKPDPAVYMLALERTGVTPDQVVFFDDLEANVATASRLGIRAFRVEGVPALRDCLLSEGLLVDRVR